MANRRFLVGLNGNNYINIGTHSFTDRDNEIECIYALDDNAKIWYRPSRNNWQIYPQSTKNYRYKVRYGVLEGRFCFFFPNYTEDENERLGTGLNLLLFSDIPVTQSITGDFFEDVTTYEEGLYIHEGETRGIQLYFAYMPQPDSTRWSEFYSINNTYENLPEYKYGGMPLPTNISYTQGMTEHEFTITVNKPIFTNIADVKRYLESGEIGASCINMDVEPVPEQNVDTFNEYYVTNEVKKNGDVVFRQNFKISIAKGSKIYFYGNGATGNNPDLTLKCTALPCKVMSGNNPSWQPVYNLGEYENAYTNKRWTDTSTGDYYVSHLYTNIPIFANQTHGQQYEDGEITESDAENNGGSGTEHPSDIGSPINSNDVNLKSCDMTGTNIWSMTVNEINGLLNQWLYNPNTSIIDEIKSAQWLWNSDPITCISSLYYVPFDVTEFYNTQSDTFHCGSYVPRDASQNSFTRTKLITSNGNIKDVTLFDTLFTPIYNDFRDYDGHVKYDLFLPFIGFVSLDPNKYVGKTVKCKMIFEATTHNVRYFMFVNGTITDRFDGSVGIEMPLLSTAKGEKLGDMLQGGQSFLSSAIASNFAKTPSEKISTTIGGITSTLDMIKSIAEHPSENYTGNFSSALNTYDVRYAYLRITINETLKPSNLETRFNYPSYYMGSGSNLSGYCEISDIRFTSFTGTDEEQNSLKNLVKSGIIL